MARLLIFLSLEILWTASSQKDSSSQIEELIPLDNFRLPFGESYQFEVAEFVRCQNATYKITPGVSAKIEEYFVLNNSFPKPNSNQFSKFGNLILAQPNSDKLLFTLSKESIVVWNLSNFTNPEKSEYQVDNSTNLLTLLEANTQNQTLIYLVEEVKAYEYKVRGFLVDSNNTLQEQKDLELTYTHENTGIQTFQVLAQNQTAYLFAVSSESFYLLESSQKTQVVANVTYENLNVNSSEFVSLAVYPENSSVFLCDRESGIYILDLEEILQQKSTLDYLHFKDPLKLGSILWCSIQNNELIVSVSTGIVKYNIPSFNYPSQIMNILRPGESPHMVLATGVSYLGKFSLYGGYFLANVSSELVTTFRIYSFDLDNYDSMIVDEWNHKLFNGTDTDAVPAFAYDEDNHALFFNTESALEVYLLNEAPKVHLDSTKTGTFKGQLNVSNPQDSRVLPLNFTVVSQNSTEIFNFRGTYPQQGFIRLTNISNYVTKVADSKTSVYLPLTNYFIGNNVSYSLSVVESSSNASTLVPEFYTQMQSVKLKGSYINPYVKWVVFSESVEYGISVSKDDIYVLKKNLTVYYHQVNQEKNTYYNHASLLYLDSESFLHLLIEVVNLETGEVKWEVLKIIDSGDASIVLTKKFSNSIPSQKIVYSAGWVFALKGQGILVYKFQTTPSLEAYSTITQSNLANFTQNFAPIDMDLENGVLYVCDFGRGVVLLPAKGSNTTYSLEVFESLKLPPDSYSRIVATENTLYILLPSSEEFLKAPLDSNKVQRFPVRNCLADQISASGNLLGVFCSGIRSSKIQVFDTSQELFASLTGEIKVDKPGAIAFRKNSEVFYYCNGELCQQYSLSQTANTWNPEFPVEYMPVVYDRIVKTLWGRIDFDYDSENVPQEFTAQLNLTAWNGWQTKSETIYLQLENVGNYVEKNSEYNTQNSNLTAAGNLEVFNQTYKELVPQEAFVGNDIVYSLIVTQEAERVIGPSEVCDKEIYPFCIESKTRNLPSLTDLGSILDMDSYNSSLYALTEDLVGTYQLGKDVPNLQSKFNVSDFLGKNSLSCYQIKALTNEVLALTCTFKNEILQNHGTYFLNLNTKEFSSFLSFSKLTLLDVYSEEGTYWVYIFDTSNLWTLKLDLKTLKYETEDPISQTTLGLNFFLPMGVGKLNLTHIVVGDYLSGILLVNTSNNQVATSYSPEEYFLNTQTSNLLAMKLLSDKETLILLMSKGDVFKLSCQDGFRVLGHYPPVGLQEGVLNSLALGINEESNFIAFPVKTTNNSLSMRVLDYSQEDSNAIYTDAFLGSVKGSIFSGSILFYENQELHTNLATNLVMQNSSKPLQLIQIRKNTNAYIYYFEENKNSNFSVQLMGSNANSNYTYQPLLVEFDGHNNNNNGSGDDDGNWDKWWVWVLVFSGGVLLTVLMIALIIHFKKRRTRNGYSNISLVVT